jgi:tetratricopeptide (TPR) repeat protein
MAIAPDQELELKRCLDEAFKAFEAGQDERARRLCRQALAIDADSTTAHSLMGLLYEREGKVGEATSEFEHVVQLNPSSLAERSTLRRLRGEEQPEPVTPAYDYDDEEEDAGRRRTVQLAGIGALLVVVAVLMAFVLVNGLPGGGKGRARGAVTAIMADLEQAQKAFEEGRYDAAMQAAQKVLDVEPDNGLARQIHDRSAAQIKGKNGLGPQPGAAGQTPVAAVPQGAAAAPQSAPVFPQTPTPPTMMPAPAPAPMPAPPPQAAGPTTYVPPAPVAGQTRWTVPSVDTGRRYASVTDVAGATVMRFQRTPIRPLVTQPPREDVERAGRDEQPSTEAAALTATPKEPEPESHIRITVNRRPASAGAGTGPEVKPDEKEAPTTAGAPNVANQATDPRVREAQEQQRKLREARERQRRGQ